MVSDQHYPFRENIPAYALGALDAEDIPALEAHLQACESCRTELAAYRAISDGLLTAIPPQQPSPALQQRLLSQLHSAAPRRPAPKIRQPRFQWSFSRLAMGAALVLLLAINLFSFAQMRELQLQQANLSQQLQNSQLTIAMLAYPGTQALPINAGNISGTVLLDKDRNTAALVAWNLPKLTAEQSYQVWLIEPNGHRVSAGVFRPDANLPYTTKTIFSNQHLSNFTGLGVTVEPLQGSDQPTGPRVFKVDF